MDLFQIRHCTEVNPFLHRFRTKFTESEGGASCLLWHTRRPSVSSYKNSTRHIRLIGGCDRSSRLAVWSHKERLQRHLLTLRSGWTCWRTERDSARDGHRDHLTGRRRPCHLLRAFGAVPRRQRSAERSASIRIALHAGSFIWFDAQHRIRVLWTWLRLISNGLALSRLLIFQLVEQRRKQFASLSFRPRLSRSVHKAKNKQYNYDVDLSMPTNFETFYDQLIMIIRHRTKQSLILVCTVHTQ